MKKTKILFAVLLLLPGGAFAQPVSERPDEVVPAVRNAFEIGVASGYTQGGGKLADEMISLGQIAGPGITVELDLGYRFTPAFSVGAYGSLAAYEPGSMYRGYDVLGATLGLQVVWHVQPARSLDPWISVGAGWKTLLASGDDDLTLRGVDLARVQFGLDFRLSKNVAVAPVIGGSISTFVSENQHGASYDISGLPQFNGFAGISGRFDLDGAR